MTDSLENMREEVGELVEKYFERLHATEEFIPGKTAIPCSGKVYGNLEIRSLLSSSLEFWLTSGRFNDAFEKKLSSILGARFARSANSGSSANLLSIACLASPSLGEKSLKTGDEVITVACGFPTTVNPLLLYGLVPVFVDVELPTYNVSVSQLEAAITPKTKAIVLAHTLGNPFNLDAVAALAKKHDLWLVEDCCDALGSTYRGQHVGTFGDFGTLSCYPAHHITMGEGGAIFSRHGRFLRMVESIRDWGRDCFCATGKENTCGKRFDWQMGDLPKGYDHKYIYSQLGFNFKITDLQASVGLAQLERLPQFLQARKSNFKFLSEKFQALEEFFVLPQAALQSDPSWFGFPLTIREKAPFSRKEILSFLTERKIGTRPLFAGNLVCQPYMKQYPHRVGGPLKNSDTVMSQTFWIGVYPGLTEAMLQYVAESFQEFARRYS